MAPAPRDCVSPRSEIGGSPSPEGGDAEKGDQENQQG